jgi:dihydrofolate reductase
MEARMRKLIAGMKVSVDGKIEGPGGSADWVEAWSEDYGLTAQIDACVLGGGMYPGYEQYWTSIQNEPDKSVWITGNAPTAAEIEWATFIKHTPHYVLSKTLTTTDWSNTTFVHDLEEISELKNRSGRDIYLIGGAKTTTSLINAGLVDELRLIVYPLIVGEGKELFSLKSSHSLQLKNMADLPGGRVSLIYGFK